MDEFCRMMGEVVRSEVRDTISLEELREAAEAATGRRALVVPAAPARSWGWGVEDHMRMKVGAMLAQEERPESAKLNCRCQMVRPVIQPTDHSEDVSMLRELWETVRDAWWEGDWVGHLRAWWAVTVGRVTPETRAGWPTQ